MLKIKEKYKNGGLIEKLPKPEMCSLFYSKPSISIGDFANFF